MSLSSASKSFSNNKKWTILGQDPDVLLAMVSNILSWFVSSLMPSFLPKLLPKCEYEVDAGNENTDAASTSLTKCISIGRPGGIEQLRVVALQPDMITKGYNVGADGSPFISRKQLKEVKEDMVVVHNHAFSVNYADCAIRWGLYESAKQFVGWPIVPGFDVAGVVTSSDDTDTNNENNFQVGDRVFGCTLFGAYSNQIAVPALQLRKIPPHLSFAEAASLPAVSLTAIYALHLAGHYPPVPKGQRKQNRGILIHSAAGGVGSMAVQMAVLLGLHPIVGVVGSSHKVEAARALGCHHVIDKSKSNLWKEAEIVSPQGYSAILDANGVSTLQDSYDHLCPTGRVIVFGFHSNLPLGKGMLSPWQWIGMGLKMARMPKFDPMDLVISNKAVMGFNLSFFAQEKELVSMLFDQVCTWILLKEKGLTCPRVEEMEGMERIGKAHNSIMSGQSIGKIVVTMLPEEEPDEI
jgi:NADPH:quinone reductase-like Zn-dependent oxidoreductase